MGVLPVNPLEGRNGSMHPDVRAFCFAEQIAGLFLVVFVRNVSRTIIQEIPLQNLTSRCLSGRPVPVIKSQRLVIHDKLPRVCNRK